MIALGFIAAGVGLWAIAFGLIFGIDLALLGGFLCVFAGLAANELVACRRMRRTSADLARARARSDGQTGDWDWPERRSA